MSYWSNVKNAFKIAIFDDKALNAVAKNKDLVNYGIITLVLVGIATSLGMLMPFMFIMIPMAFFLSIGFNHLIAKLFGGKASFSDYFGVLSNATVIYWLAVVPLLGAVLVNIIGIWFSVISVYITHKVHKLSVFKSIIVVFLLPLLVVLLMMLLVAFLGVLNPQGFMPV